MNNLEKKIFLGYDAMLVWDAEPEGEAIAVLPRAESIGLLLQQLNAAVWALETDLTIQGLNKVKIEIRAAWEGGEEDGLEEAYNQK